MPLKYIYIRPNTITYLVYLNISLPWLRYLHTVDGNEVEGRDDAFASCIHTTSHAIEDGRHCGSLARTWYTRNVHATKLIKKIA